MKRFLIRGILALTAVVSAASGTVRGTASDSTAVPASDTELIRGTYTYTYGDRESLVDARQTCKELAVRDAVESYYLFLESVSTVENSVVRQDLVRSIAAGCVRNLRVTDQQEAGRTLTCTVEGEVNPGEVSGLIAARQSADSSGLPVPAGAFPDLSASAGTSGNEPDSARGDEDPRFAALLSRYENRTVSAERDFGRARYDEALERLKETDALLKAFPDGERGVFQSEMLRSMTRSNRLATAVARFEKNKAARSAGRQPLLRIEIRRAAEELERSLESLARLDGLSQKQMAVRKAWTLRCRGQLARSAVTVR
ncbi:MAG: hypothetical protein QUS35_04230 [bacterium]|nr:hypothetical protein [bacterium]